MHEVAAAEHVGAHVAIHQGAASGRRPPLLRPQEAHRRHLAGQLLRLRTTIIPEP